MSDLENLVDALEDYERRIRKLWVNYQKLATAKKTPQAIKSRLADLQEHKLSSNEIHKKILSITDKKLRQTHPYFVNETFDSLIETVEEVRDALNGALEALVEENSTSTGSASAAQTPRNTPVDLTPIHIPKFSGEFDAWFEFRDLFLSLVDARKDLADIQKFHYLKSSVVGHAARVLRHLQVTDSNYKAAWELLKRRYENPRAILYTYLDDLLAMPKVGSNRKRDLLNLRDTAFEIYNNILGLSRPINMWEDQFIHFILSRLDEKTRHAWEISLPSGDMFPSFDQLDAFLSHQLEALRSSGNKDPAAEKRQFTRHEKPTHIRAHQATTSKLACFVCSGDHPLFQCSKFVELSPEQRLNLIRTHDRCINCFRLGHRPATCANKNTCRHCHRKHNSLLHSAFQKPDHSPNDSSTSIVAHCANFQITSVILPTATIVVSVAGQSCSIRALLDQGSQATFISETIFQLLKPEYRSVSLKVTGICAGARSVVKAAAYLSVGPHVQAGESTMVRAFVLPRLTNSVPPLVDIDDTLPHLQGLPLADATLNTKEPIHIIIGSDYFGTFLLEGLRKGKPSEPIAQLTSFGWVLSGPTSLGASPARRIVVNLAHAEDDLDASLARIWELDEVPSRSLLTSEEAAAETQFQNSVCRLPNGRYQVQLPFKSDRPTNLVESREPVRSMFLRQEARLLVQPEKKRQYDLFLREYLELGHMEEVPSNSVNEVRSCYLPHHPVYKHSSPSTKIRVVFNASYRVKGGRALNDYLLVGPKLQADLFALILNWRRHRFVAATDIEKMFRQILITPSDTDLQRIFWRPEQNGPLKCFRLRTVTYGTACAPFLANRVLRQLSQDEKEHYPEASKILAESVYVDDVMFGADDIASLGRLRDQLVVLLMAGGFQCHKWASNSTVILDNLPSHKSVDAHDKKFGDEPETKILGIHWRPSSDTFHFRVTTPPTARSKRAFLSLASRLFDPLGWVSPVTINAKIILQSLWLRKIDWDDPLPDDIAKQCYGFQQALTKLSSVSVPRWTGQSPRQPLEIHGFCDASNVAYAACIYMKIFPEEGEPSCTLLFSKAKVAPVKVQSVPRLELCAATLLVRALKFVTDSMGLSAVPVHCWTDSKVVLAWLQSHPSKWKVFVANRVSEIQVSFPKARWRHVPTKDNPADCASRGLDPSQLLCHALWWTGPAWLRKPPSEWPLTVLEDDPFRNVNEIHATLAVCSTAGKESLELFQRVSSWRKLVRVFAYVRRFINHARRVNRDAAPRSTVVTSQELESATLYLCKLVQRAYIPHIVKILSSKPTSRVDKGLSALAPFLDKYGLVRVGGRLRNASIPYEQKFPIYIPPSHTASLLVQHFHLLSLHGGLQLTLTFLRQQFWVPRARSLVKKCIRGCVVCARHRAQLCSQQMSPLPSARVTPARPFSHSGVDYAGPFLIRAYKGRGHKTHKAYCAIFVCLVTRAIHLECVSDYSTQGFIAALNRFISRRGLPSDLYSDNGSNFVGADRELRANLQQVLAAPELQERLANDGINWHFNPPAAPHFGGLWEAGVKSVKHHFRRIMGNFTPTYEEFATLLCKIEGVLNSRPLTPLRDDLDSLEALTPGHFLVGSVLSSLPSPSVLEVPENHLSRWQEIQRLSERFWRVWSTDYLNSLQQRTKWREMLPNLRIGDLVLIKNPHLPPSKWELGRVKETLPGQDGCIRVVRVRTALSEYSRPVTQLCRLPVDSRNGANPTSS